MAIVVIGPSTRWTAFIAPARLALDDPAFFTEEIDCDKTRDLSAGIVDAVETYGENADDYCWASKPCFNRGTPWPPNDHDDDCTPMRVVAIRDNLSDTFVYDERNRPLGCRRAALKGDRRV